MIDRWAGTGVSISLVESPDIGTVGVGEGSTPRLKQFFDTIGIEESDWMPKCNATYKNGIAFANWSTKRGFERYFHPFPSQADRQTATAYYFNTYARRQGIDLHAHPDRFFLAAKLAESKCGPKPDETFPVVVEYGYHFDANLLGDFLRARAVARGVSHVQAKVMQVTQSTDGDISELQTDTGTAIGGDFFVDCSGFRSQLLQQTLEVPFRSFAENLFNDSAVVLPSVQTAEIGSQTVSTALKYGWAWEIPLTHRIGNGYVYSSAYCSANEAETELRAHLGLLESDTPARHLKMKVGRVERHWHRNCLAVGLSQGFIEPLEATALNLVCNTVDDFITTVEGAGLSGDGRDAFNARVNQGFENVRDYIVAHYILNSRSDTEYWVQNGANRNVSAALRQILEIWKTGKSLSQEIKRQKIPTSYSAMSWYCLLGGYGIYPEIRPTAAESAAASKVNMFGVDEFIRRSALHFRSQNEQLQFS